MQEIHTSFHINSMLCRALWIGCCCCCCLEDATENLTFLKLDSHSIIINIALYICYRMNDIVAVHTLLGIDPKLQHSNGSVYVHAVLSY